MRHVRDIILREAQIREPLTRLLIERISSAKIRGTLALDEELFAACLPLCFAAAVKHVPDTSCESFEITAEAVVSLLRTYFAGRISGSFLEYIDKEFPSTYRDLTDPEIVEGIIEMKRELLIPQADQPSYQTTVLPRG